MSKTPFLERIQHSPILADGAMGTTLHQIGLNLGSCFDAFNLTDPNLVQSVHRQFIEAGAQLIETNTFSANPYKLKEYNYQDQTIEINEAGVELARHAIEEAQRQDEIYIAGSVGPLGVYIAPLGRVKEQQAYQAFRKQISPLIHNQVDVLFLETFSDLQEIAIAIRVARDINPAIPIVASMTFTRDDRTLLGDSPVYVAQKLQELGADIIGVNCSSGPVQLRRILTMMRRAVPSARFSVMPNAGWPETIHGRLMYPATPDYFGEYAVTFAELGASIIGGCCGTTPAHTHSMRKALDAAPQPDATQITFSPEESEPILDSDLQPTQLQRSFNTGQFVVTVEMAPPRGSGPEKVVAAAEMLRSAGVGFINVSDSPMARMRMSPWAVSYLIQERVGLETVLHFPTRGRNLLRVQGDLLAAHALNVRNVFVVMGDPTKIGDYPEAFDTHDVVPSGLVQIIKQQLNVGLDQAGNPINHPTNFFVGTALNFGAADLDKEVKLLRKKIDAGADFALSQPVYDPHNVEKFLQRYSEIFGQLEIPVLVGILPLFNARHASFLHNEVPGVHIPASILERLDQAEDASAVGVEIAQSLLLDLKDMVQGAYLMPPFAKYHLAAEVVDALALPAVY